MLETLFDMTLFAVALVLYYCGCTVLDDEMTEEVMNDYDDL